MLTRTVHPRAAAELGPVALAAMLDVLGRLERDEIPFGSVQHALETGGLSCPSDIPETLNMAWLRCGTAGCLLGWMCFVAHDKHLLPSYSGALNDLFCLGSPKDHGPRGKEMSEIRPVELASAIRNYLAGVEMPWKGVFDVK